MTAAIFANGGLVRGRKPKPTALHIFNNRPGHRRLNENEPQHAPIDQAVPEELRALGDTKAIEVWERLMPQLAETGHITAVDRDVLIAYCVQYSEWLFLKAKANEAAAVVNAPSGYQIQSPYRGMANKAFLLMLKAAAELGITPSSRSRVVANRGQHAGDEFAQHQASRPKLSAVK